ncbi:hypothetical protein D1872_326440 [compost metagenome]
MRHYIQATRNLLPQLTLCSLNLLPMPLNPLIQLCRHPLHHHGKLLLLCLQLC